MSNAKDEMKLRECPWGCVVRFGHSWLPTYVYIAGCAHATFSCDVSVGATGAPDFETGERELAAQWNRRTPSPMVEKMYEAAKSALAYIETSRWRVDDAQIVEDKLRAAITAYEEAKVNG